MATEKRYISKGSHCVITASGTSFVSGTQYTACLYYSAKDAEHRANVTTTAVTIPATETTPAKVQCVFDFNPAQTASLKAGNAILEIYDTTTIQRMAFWDEYATVRSSSLKE